MLRKNADVRRCSYFELGVPVVLYPALELLVNVRAWWNEKQVYSKTMDGPAVIGHSCCGVPANVLSVCLFVCLFFLAKLVKKKQNKNKIIILLQIGASTFHFGSNRPYS